MFNRLPFNWGKFNIGSATNDNAGSSRLTMGSGASATRIIQARPLPLALKLNTAANATVIKLGLPQPLRLRQQSAAAYLLRKFGTGQTAMRLESSATYLIWVEEPVILENLNFRPGDTLVIDTCNLTVTLNGQDVMEHFSELGDFFQLLPGQNLLLHQDDANSRQLNYSILWKPRWL